MPPSPTMRVSPRRRELREDNYKRGRSLESRRVSRDSKEDDLALFIEVQKKERDNYLLQSSDDIDEIFGTKFNGFSDFKHDFWIPPRGGSSDLLYEEGDKNDYEWLITPPEAPLFPSLDDEPVSRPKSSSAEKGYNRRGSPSPRRRSPSPSRGLSPPPNPRRMSTGAVGIRGTSPPLRGLSPPPRQPSPAQRSNSPNPRRLSTGSVGTRGTSLPVSRGLSPQPRQPSPAQRSNSPNIRRGISPIKTNRGNSPSPKTGPWQANIPGFPTETPPNLRTSDKPASNVRSSSPASRNGPKSSRRSMSPVASRSVSSSHSYGKEDDVDSLSVSSSTSSRGVRISKKPNATLSNSAPKRSFDVALRQMDRQVPQNMFRPLISSVPNTTFNAANVILSTNSSMTTSTSYTSSDQGTNGFHDTVDQELFTGESGTHYLEGPNSKNNVSEGAAGISLLLNQISKKKRHIVQSKSFTATNLSYDDISFLRDSVNSIDSYTSTSMSSSVDLESSKDRKTDEMPTRNRRRISSFSGAISVDQQEKSVPSKLKEGESTSDSLHKVLEKSTVVLEDLNGTKARSLTLEEATDTILFCSSIVHNLAYEAANIAIEKDYTPTEVILPTVTSFDKSNSDLMDIRSRTQGRQKEMTIHTKPPPTIVIKTDDKYIPRIVEDPNCDTVKPLKLESKCNCTIM